MKQMYEPIMGIEVHVELNTKTKMFCRCSADYFGKEPNTHTCPVCLGLPGALPFINEEALNKCMQIGLALNCSVTTGGSYFERKNYFYPDLPKGYQISQLIKPLNVNGWLDVEDRDGKVVRIRINRAHQEEDTGKLTHKDGETLIDFNRSGVPLVEVVTEPDFHDSAQVRDYAKKLQQIFRDLGVSNADMEKGDMRLEANVSVRPAGQTELPPYRVELKNINSFNFMVQAIEYEIQRQIKALEAGEKLTQETRGWNEDKKETYLQRSKEDAHDYRYFPEPDLPELLVDTSDVERIKSQLPELSISKVKRLEEKFGLTKQIATTLVNQGLVELFEEVVKMGGDVKKVANFLINRKVDPATSPQQVIDDIKSKSVGVIGDAEEIEKLVKHAIEENPKVVEDYKGGKETAIQFLIGMVMRKSAGKADTGKAKEILEKLLRTHNG